MTREQDQQDLAKFGRAHRIGVYHATPEELRSIDQALGHVARGEIASSEEIEAAFANFRDA